MNRFGSWTLGLATFVLLCAACVWNYTPPLGGRQTFEIVFPSPLPVGTADPLVVTGQAGAGDFLYVRYASGTSIVLGYDSWGHGGPSSQPLTIEPGSRHSLQLELPSLDAVAGHIERPSEKIRVILDGLTVLETEANFHPRTATQVYFGRNPLGGSACGPEFRGQLAHENGRPAVTADPAKLPIETRIRLWLWHGRWQLAFNLIASLGLVWVWRRHRKDPTACSQSVAKKVVHAALVHRSFLLTAAICCIVFSAVVTGGTFRFLFRESFGDFYDFQALSLLQGRLDVPAGCLPNEVFLYEGKTYGYFGITPALLRLPFVIFGVAFGELSRTAMLLYYAGALVGAYLLLLDGFRLLRPEQPRPATWQTVIFVVHVGLGSTVFFLGSRAYIYHEAILCGVMFALLSCWCSLRHLSAPAGRWWIGALALGVLSVHARPPTGLFALTMLGVVALIQFLESSKNPKLPRVRRLRPLAIGALAVSGVASFNALSYAKFRTFEGCPLRLNVQYDAARLARIDNTQFHLSNLPYGFAAYFWRPSVEITARFPWLYMGPGIPRGDFPAAKIDYPDRTMALPYGMTGLFALALIAGPAVWHRRGVGQKAIIVVLASVAPLSLAMCAAIAVAERYTGDFVPFLVCAGALGLAARVWARVSRLALTVATFWACALTFAMTLHYQGAVVWGVPEAVKENYRELRTRVDGIFVGSAATKP